MIRAKKSLGQNFLIDKNILEKITNSADINNKIILEIGPGTGNLTSHILKKNPKKMFVIEKDNGLASDLENKFNNQITIINEDVLKYLQIAVSIFLRSRIVISKPLTSFIPDTIVCKRTFESFGFCLVILIS